MPFRSKSGNPAVYLRLKAGESIDEGIDRLTTAGWIIDPRSVVVKSDIQGKFIINKDDDTAVSDDKDIKEVTSRERGGRNIKKEIDDEVDKVRVQHKTFDDKFRKRSDRPDHKDFRDKKDEDKSEQKDDMPDFIKKFIGQKDDKEEEKKKE